MSWVSISVLITSIFQVVCLAKLKWRLVSWIAVIVARGLFLLRIKGILFKLKPLWMTEGLVIALQLIVGMMHPEKMNWLFLVLFIFNSLISIGIEIIDDKFYVYKIEEYKEDEDF